MNVSVSQKTLYDSNTDSDVYTEMDEHNSKSNFCMRLKMRKVTEHKKYAGGCSYHLNVEGSDLKKYGR